MINHGGKLIILSFIPLLILMVLLGCLMTACATPESNKAQEQPAAAGAPTTNRPPVINSLTTSQANVTYGGRTDLTCDAVDPDGDALRYSWSASEGSISGEGKTVTWVGPNKGGDYNIWVTVSDGKAESRRNVVVTVMPATGTTTLTLVRNESGTVFKYNVKDTSDYRAGDDENDGVYRCFFSFNILSLNGQQVTGARLKFGPCKVTGDPFASPTGLRGLRLWRVKYAPDLPQFDILGETLERAAALLLSAPVEVDVTPEVVDAVTSAAERFQVEALFDRTANGNKIADYIEFSDVILEITFAPR